MKKLLLFSATFILFSTVVSAYPIPPRPLRMLVMESQYIVQGMVLSSGEEKPAKGGDNWNNDFVIIRISQVLQGNLAQKTLKVYYTRGLVCPSPPHFEIEKEAIFFLDTVDKKKQGFEVHALSYGVKNFLNEEGLDVYKKRISEIQGILTLKDKKQQDAAVLEWLVNCAVDKQTRWEGVYELSPESDFMSAYDRDRDGGKEIYLSSSQRQRIFNAIMIADTLQYDDMGMVDMAMGVDDNKLLESLRKGLNSIDTAENTWYAEYIMERIVRLTGDPDLDQLLNTFKESSFNEKNAALHTKLFLEFRKKMQNVQLKKTLYADGNKTV